jgi:hypothetical protein
MYVVAFSRRPFDNARLFFAKKNSNIERKNKNPLEGDPEMGTRRETKSGNSHDPVLFASGSEIFWSNESIFELLPLVGAQSGRLSDFHMVTFGRWRHFQGSMK